MNKYEKKYNNIEDEKTKEFHRSRRMFAIKDNKLFIAPKGADYSHAIWFENLKWIVGEDDSVMNSITRGFVAANGDICFFTGYTFQVNILVEKDLKFFLPELVRKLKLNKNALVFGGQYKNEEGKYQPRINYGRVENLVQ